MLFYPCVSKAGLATKQLYISFAPSQKTRLVLFSKGKGRQRKLFQIKRRQAPKIAWFQRQRTPRRHARYSDASESLMRLARISATFSCADMAFSSSLDYLIPQMFKSSIRIMSSYSAPTLMIIRANFTLVSASLSAHHPPAVQYEGVP